MPPLKSYSDKVREKNRLANIYKREADIHKIGSPSRIDEYINYRMKGKSQDEALALCKNQPKS